MRPLLILSSFLILAPTLSSAEAVRRACLASERQAAAPRLCKCIQIAADATLDPSGQALAASFFADPHRAQEIRQSKQRGHGEFWERYKEFSALAKAFCAS